MRVFRGDLHIHTCLSPCGELEMSPMGIVNEAANKGIDVIAICDHNSAENVTAVMEASSETALAVFPGMEITSREEVHVLGIFDRPEDAIAVQSLLYEHLPGRNDEATFGPQVIVDRKGTVLRYNKKLLIGATDLSLETIVDYIHLQNGLAIAAHIDREGFGILGQLGFIPEGLELDALEVSPRLTLKDAQDTFNEYTDFPLLRSSDAHRLNEIGSGTTPFLLETSSFDELKMALTGEQGRYIRYDD